MAAKKYDMATQMFRKAKAPAGQGGRKKSGAGQTPPAMRMVHKMAKGCK